VWVVSGAVIYTSLLVIAGCLSFGAVGPWAQHYMVVQHVLNAARYPVSIYPRWLQIVMLAVLPIATASFVPCAWLAGRGPLWEAIVVPVGAAGAIGVFSSWLWRRAIQGYQSSGS
jgi:ABC-2 type transport system permease protein